MTDDADHFRFVDFTEHPIVLLVGADGTAELHGDDEKCTIEIAAALFVIGRQLIAEHCAEHCEPTGGVPVWQRPDEAVAPGLGSLDREAQVWTDGTGHAWDLSMPWRDKAGSTWLWYGSLDRQGAPLMRSNDWPHPQPLDALRHLRGPMAPVNRGGAA